MTDLKTRLSNLILPAIFVVLVLVGVAIAATAIHFTSLPWAILLCLGIAAALGWVHAKHLNDGWGFMFATLILPVWVGMFFGVVGTTIWLWVR